MRTGEERGHGVMNYERAKLFHGRGLERVAKTGTVLRSGDRAPEMMAQERTKAWRRTYAPGLLRRMRSKYRLLPIDDRT